MTIFYNHIYIFFYIAIHTLLFTILHFPPKKAHSFWASCFHIYFVLSFTCFYKHCLFVCFWRGAEEIGRYEVVFKPWHILSRLQQHYFSFRTLLAVWWLVSKCCTKRSTSFLNFFVYCLFLLSIPEQCWCQSRWFFVSVLLLILWLCFGRSTEPGTGLRSF